jgi:hypothetical protein
MEINSKERRPLATRDQRWAQNSARWLGKMNITPNQISLASIVCALMACVAFSLAFTCLSVWAHCCGGSLLSHRGRPR